MIYSVVQILRSLSSTWVTFRTLQQIELQRNKDGALQYSIGNSAVVVKAKVAGEYYALKCYTTPSEHRKAIYRDKLLPAELMIPLEQGVQWVDISLERWCEGEALGEAILRFATSRDIPSLESLSCNFDRLALELLAEEWAHGDITCDNIILDAEGSLHLIDFDGSFLPEFSGEQSSELGTEAFQHPARTISHFDRTIDDYPLALISTALATLRLDPSLIEKSSLCEGLLFTPSECVAGRSETLEQALLLLSQDGRFFDYRIAMMLRSPTVSLPELYSILRYKVEGIHAASNPTTTFTRDGLWGYLNEFSRQAIPPIFTSAHNFKNGKAAVKIGEVWHIINPLAEVIVNGSRYKTLRNMQGGSIQALSHDGKWEELATISNLRG
ncbi:MAG: WG repeat-containing protein [Rikenellaceae bacterium]